MTATFDFDDGGGSGSALLDTLRRLLPVLLVAMLLAGNLFFVITQVMPAWTAYDDMASQVAQAEQQVEAKLAQGVNDQVDILRYDLEQAQAILAFGAKGFLSPDQSALLVEQIYQLADDNGVIVQALRASEENEDEAVTTYITQRIELEITAVQVTNVLDYMTAMREATVPGVSVHNVQMSASKDDVYLLLEVTLYISPLADGSVFEDLPVIERATLSFEGMVALHEQIEAEATPTPPPAATSVAAVPPSAEATSEAGAMPLEVTATAEMPPAPVDVECPGAPPPAFNVGDTVVVDFEIDSSLRILRQPRLDDSPVVIIVHAEDGDVLQLLGGPVCGTWLGMPIYYWYVAYGDFMGWAGEASINNRWMCPIDDPECG